MKDMVITGRKVAIYINVPRAELAVCLTVFGACGLHKRGAHVQERANHQRPCGYTNIA